MDILKARKKALEGQKGNEAEAAPVKRPVEAPVEPEAPPPPPAPKKPSKPAKPKPPKKAPAVSARPEESETVFVEPTPPPPPVVEEPRKIRDVSAIPMGARAPEEIELMPHEVHDLPGTQDMPELPDMSDEEMRGAVELGSMIDEHPVIEHLPPPPKKAEAPVSDEPVEQRHGERRKSKQVKEHEAPPPAAPVEAPAKIEETKCETPSMADEAHDDFDSGKEIISADDIPLEFLSFMIGKEEYGVPLYKISETIKPRVITEVPRVPKFVLGILTLRGVVIPIYDLAKKLALGAVEKSKYTRIIIVNREEEKIGLMVDRVKDVVRVLPCDIEPPPTVVSGVDMQFIQGVGRAESAEFKRKLADSEDEGREEEKDMKKMRRRLVILLDLDRVTSL